MKELVGSLMQQMLDKEFDDILNIKKVKKEKKLIQEIEVLLLKI